VSPALFLILWLSAGQHGGRGATGCWSACQRHVRDAALRAQVCRLCITTGQTDAWVLELARRRPVPEEVLRSALGDPDWRVRWGALRAQAKVRGLTEPGALADWVAGASPEEEGRACLTAARVAATAGLSTASYLEGAGARGGLAATRVWARRESIREVLELEVYAEDRQGRGEALSHLARFLGQAPARVALEAMARRPATADEAPASALLALAGQEHTSVGRMLLLEAKPSDEVLINRLFAIYSGELEALRKGLTSTDTMQRRASVQALWRYGPLARRELERALEDPELQVRRLAAHGLAEAEGLSLLEIAGQRLRAEGALAARSRWLEVAAAENGCEPFLLSLARDGQLPAEVRGAAVGWLAECDGGARRRFQVLAPFLRDELAPVRAGAVRALAVPRSPEGDAAIAAALEDAAPEVVATALDVVARRSLRALGEEVAARLDSPSPEVREAAARALERIGRPQHVRPLARTLAEDTVASVRVAAAQALASLGGPFAASALSQALAKDPDSHVRHVSRRGLERLGFHPP
jgi:HEAT repeat protein